MENNWAPLSMIERRVLGVLVEKGKTSPETYPLSLNSVTTASNQKSNRDPVLNLDESDVEEVLDRLQEKLLVIKITGSRVDRWRHNLYEAWTQNKVELAVLAELLLRGPQTEGELRTRASRMDPIESLDELREVLEPLVQRKLVVYLTPPKSRGATLTHGFHTPEELQRLKSGHAASFEEPSPAPRPSSPTLAPVPAPAAVPSAELMQLRSEIQDLRSVVDKLQAEFLELKRSLGG